MLSQRKTSIARLAAMSRRIHAHIGKPSILGDAVIHASTNQPITHIPAAGESGKFPQEYYSTGLPQCITLEHGRMGLLERHMKRVVKNIVQGLLYKT